jgi:hypothetical protein
MKVFEKLAANARANWEKRPKSFVVGIAAICYGVLGLLLLAYWL